MELEAGVQEGNSNTTNPTVAIEENQNTSNEKEHEPTPNHTKPLRPPDGKYAWIVATAAFFIHFTTGFMYSFGVFLIPLSNEFGVGRGTVSWVGSLMNSFMLFAAYFASLLIIRFSFRRVVFAGFVLLVISLLVTSWMTTLGPIFFTWGVIGGLGVCLSFIPVISCVSQWFEKYQSLSIGFAVSGTGIGNMVYPLIANAIINELGWRIAIRILCATMVIIAISSLALVPRLPMPKGSVEINLKKVIKERAFIVLGSSAFFSGYIFLVPFVHMYGFAVDAGISESNASVLLALTGISSTIGRVILGILSDRFGKVKIYKITTSILPISVFIWIWVKNFYGLLPIAIFIGFVCGGFVSMVPPLVARYFGVKRMSSVLGLIYPISGFGVLIGSPITGVMYDYYGRYNEGLYVATAIGVIAAIILQFLPPFSTETERMEAKSEKPIMEPIGV